MASPASATPPAACPPSDEGPFAGATPPPARVVPPRRPMHLLPVALLLAGLAGASALRAAPVPAPPPGPLETRMLRLTELLDTRLPGILGVDGVVLRLQPRLGDLRDREYLRLPFELRRGIAERTELAFGLTPFTANPFRRGPDHRHGLGEVRMEVRRELGLPAGSAWRADAALEARFPLGRPPAALNDGFAHLTPKVALSRPWPGWHGALAYGEWRHDWGLPHPARPAERRAARRRWDVTAALGLLFQPEAWGAFAEHHLRQVGEDRTSFAAPESRVGVVWAVPIARSQAWGLPGIWRGEVAYRHVHTSRPGSEFESGLVTRVRWNLRLRPPAVTDQVSPVAPRSLRSR